MRFMAGGSKGPPAVFNVKPLTGVNQMIKRISSIAAICVATMMLSGCAKDVQQTGFLSTYANLEPQSSTFMRYIAPNNALGQYDKFILDPIQVHFYDPDETKDIKPEDIEHLQQYFYDQIRKDLEAKYQLVTDPGPGVARIRIAITDLKQSTPALNIIPQTKLTGLGLGQASVEGEVVDSVSGTQLAAAIESQTGSRFSFSGLSKWGDVEAVMNDWAARLVKRIDEAHAPQ